MWNFITPWNRIIDSLIQHYLPYQNHRVRYLSDFTFLYNKAHGSSFGGVYLDTNNEFWIIKGFQQNTWQSGFEEFIAGELFRYFLGDNAPETALVYNRDTNHILIGSKIIRGFQTLTQLKSNTLFKTPHGNPTAFEYDICSLDIDKTINGHPVLNYPRMVLSTLFVCDVDAHNSNVGVLFKNNSYEAVKIDHGYAFAPPCGKTDPKIFLESIKNAYLYNFPKTRSCSHEHTSYPLLQEEVKRFAKIPYEDLAVIVHQRCELIKPYIYQHFASIKAAWPLTRFFDGIGTILTSWKNHDHIDKLEEDILLKLKYSLSNFQALANLMENEEKTRQSKAHCPARKKTVKHVPIQMHMPPSARPEKSALTTLPMCSARTYLPLMSATATSQQPSSIRLQNEVSFHDQLYFGAYCYHYVKKLLPSHWERKTTDEEIRELTSVLQSISKTKSDIQRLLLSPLAAPGCHDDLLESIERRRLEYIRIIRKVLKKESTCDNELNDIRAAFSKMQEQLASLCAKEKSPHLSI